MIFCGKLSTFSISIHKLVLKNGGKNVDNLWLTHFLTETVHISKDFYDAFEGTEFFAIERIYVFASN